MRPECGCGRPAEYLVYEHREPHCGECFLDALYCSGFDVIVSKPVDWGEWYETRSKDQSGRR